MTTTAPNLGRLAALVNTLGNGPQAELRRLDPCRTATWPTAFYRLFTAEIEPHLRDVGEDAQRAWAAILSGMATLPQGVQHPGTALALARYSELRLNRLLSARDGRLLDEFRAAVCFLAAKKTSADWPQFGQLALHDPDSPLGQRLRCTLATAYYRTLSAKD